MKPTLVLSLLFAPLALAQTPQNQDAQPPAAAAQDQAPQGQTQDQGQEGAEAQGGFGGVEESPADVGLRKELDQERAARVALERRVQQLEAARQAQQAEDQALAARAEALEQTAAQEQQARQAQLQRKTERERGRSNVVSTLEALDAPMQSGESDVDDQLAAASASLDALAGSAQGDSSRTEAGLMNEARTQLELARDEAANGNLYVARGRLELVRTWLTHANQVTGMQPPPPEAGQSESR